MPGLSQYNPNKRNEFDDSPDRTIIGEADLTRNDPVFMLIHRFLIA